MNSIPSKLSLDELLQRLIAFPTISGAPEPTQEALDWIAKQLHELPLTITRSERSGFPMMLITTRATKRPRLWLAAHLDVVPAPAQAFTPHVRSGRIYGRGSFDMKFAIACYIHLLQRFDTKLKEFDIGVMITCDEELGGENGVGYLLDSGYSSDAVFIPDGGRDWQIVSGSRGMWHLLVTATGKTQHGSKPWLGINAIDGLTNFLAKLEPLFPDEPCGQLDHYHNSMNIGVINGGEAVNQVPDQATAKLDIRLLPQDDHRLRSAIDDLAKDSGHIRLETLASGPGYSVDATNSYVVDYLASLRAFGIEPTYAVTYGSSDARYFAAHNIAPIVLRPTGAGHHSASEWIDLAELDRFYNILEHFVRATCQQRH